MRHLISLPFVLLLFSSCENKQVQQLQHANYFTVDSIPGYLIKIDSSTISVYEKSIYVCDAFIIRADSQYLYSAKIHDSIDIARGFVKACALQGPLTTAEPFDIEISYSIDSTFEYNNKFNVRCFFVKIIGIISRHGKIISTANYYGYFVDISKGTDYRLIEIPCNLGAIRWSEKRTVSKLLADNIKLNP